MTICFSEHAIYGDRLVPCRTSDLHPAADLGLPCVGDDILLDNATAVYEVEHVGVDGDPARCILRKLRWNKGERGGCLPKFRGHTAGRSVSLRLGAGGDDTFAWRPADRRYTILSTVALGRCKDFGGGEPNYFGDVKREPSGYHSVQGTERDLTDTSKGGLKGGIPQIVFRRSKECTDYRHDYQPLVQRGREFGRQYAIWRSEYARPQYLVTYHRRRTRAPPNGGGEGGGGDHDCAVAPVASRKRRMDSWPSWLENDLNASDED